jgi:MFS family permease
LSTFQIVPYFAFGLFAGALADRVDRRRLMVTCDLLNALLLATIPLAALFDRLTVTQIFAVAPLVMTVYVWFDAANFGALPTLVGRERMVEANSIVYSTSTFLGIAMPAVAGLLVATIGAASALTLDALSFAASAVILVSIPRAFNTARSTKHDPVGTETLVRRTFADIREGFGFLWQQRIVRALTLLGFGVSLTSGAATGLLVVYAVQALGLAREDPRIGTLYTAGAIGALAAGLALPRLVKRVAPARITLIGLVLNPLALLATAFAPTLLIGLGAYLVWSAMNSLIIINGISLRQTVTPEHLQSRVNTTARMIAWGGAPFGAALGGVVAEWSDVRTAYLLMAGGVIISALVGWLSPLRSAPSITAETGTTEASVSA